MSDNLNDGKKSFPVGMRIIKTVLASFICMVIDYFIGQIPFQSVITTAICIQPSKKDTLTYAVSRLGGTLIGAAIGTAVYYLFSPLSSIHLLAYYLVAAICNIPLIFLDTHLKMHSGVIISLVVYFSIALANVPINEAPTYVISRIISTLIGIAVAVPINYFLPGSQEGDKE